MNMASKDPRVQAFRAYAAHRLQAGYAPPMVVNELVHQGLHPKAANALVANIRGTAIRGRAAKEAKKQARMNGVGGMLFGAVICCIGIGITVWSYSSAEPGGRYRVAFGAIAVGALAFFGGLIQAITGQEDEDSS